MNVTRSKRRGIPSFSLYGEQSGETGRAGALHIEDIQSRSRKYLWRIGTHRHAKLCQCVYVTAGPATVHLELSHTELEGPAVIIIPSGTVHGFAFRAESQGYVLTMDLGRVLSVASPAHQAPHRCAFFHSARHAVGFGPLVRGASGATARSAASRIQAAR